MRMHFYNTFFHADYVEGRYISPAGDDAPPLDALSILRQATQGMILKIISREIKYFKNKIFIT